MTCPTNTRVWCAPRNSGLPGLTLPELGSILPTTPLTRTFFVSKAFDGIPNGSITAPFNTIQGAINAATVLPDKQMLKVIFIAPDFYDEDLTIPVFSSYIGLLGLGPWVLGDNQGSFPCVSSVARNITLVVDDDNDGPTNQNRSGVAIGTIAQTGESSSTFTALASSALISGGIQTDLISSDGRLHELHLANAKFCEDVNLDFNGTTEFDIYAYQSYFDKKLAATRSNLEVINSTQFDDSITIKTWGRFTECEIRAGMIAGTASDAQNNGSLPPSGMFQCELSGTFESLNGAGADPFPLDGSSNFFFKANGAGLTNATKLILDDLVA